MGVFSWFYTSAAAENIFERHFTVNEAELVSPVAVIQGRFNMSDAALCVPAAP